MIATEPRVELADVGSLACLYRSDSGALSMLTPAARAAWLARDLGQPIDDPALIATCREHGFLDAPRGDQAFVSTTFARVPAKPLLDGRYALGPGRACRLTVDAEPLASLLAAVLRPLACSDNGPAAIAVAVTGVADGTEVRVDGHVVFRGEIAAARSETLRQIVLALVGWDRVGALLHASTVAGPDGGVALIGRSGSGKSTLAAELVADGLRYVADDLSALDREANAVHGFPLGLSTKTGSTEIVGRRFPELYSEPELTTRRITVRYLDLRARAAGSDGPAPLGAMVFPIFDGRVTAIEAERLSPEAALHLAIDAGSVPDGSPRSVYPLARLCNEVPAWHLAYGDVTAASAWIRALLKVAS